MFQWLRRHLSRLWGGRLDPSHVINRKLFIPHIYRIKKEVSRISNQRRTSLIEMAFNVGRKDIDERLGWKRNSKMWLKCHDFPKRRRRKIVVYSLEYSTAQSDREREAFGLFPSSVPSFGNVPYLLVIPIVFFFLLLLLLEREKNTQVQGGPKKIFRPSSTTFVVVEITFSYLFYFIYLFSYLFIPNSNRSLMYIYTPTTNGKRSKHTSTI